MLPDPGFLPGLGQPKGFILNHSNHLGRTGDIGLQSKTALKRQTAPPSVEN